MFKHIAFDFDGTLVDSRAAFLSLYNEFAAQHGYLPMTPDNIEHLRGLDIAGRCKYLKVPMYKLPFIVAAALKKYKSLLPELEFNEGIKELLETFSAKGMPYTLVSSNSKSNIREFFALQGAPVEDIYTSGKIFGKDKMLKKLLKDKNVHASEILYVGDELRDVIACHKAGVKVAWVSWGYDALAALENNTPDYIIHHPQELHNILFPM